MNDPAAPPPSPPPAHRRPDPATDTAVQRVSRWGRETPLLASLRTRLSLLVLAGVAPFFALIVLSALEQRRAAVESAWAGALQMVRAAGERQDEILESARQLLATLALLQEVQDHDRAACERIFTNLLALHPVYANLGAIAPDGQAFASALPLPENRDLSDRLYFQLALSNRQFSLGEYQVGRFAQKPTLNVAYPALDEQGQVRAVVYAALDLSWLQTMLTNSTLPPGSSLTLLDRNRVTLARYPDPEGKITGTVLPDWRSRTNQGPGQPRLVEPPRRAVSPSRGGARPNERTFIATGRDGVRRLYATTRLGHASDSNPVTITVGIPVSEAFAPANRALRRNLLALGLVTLVAVGAVWVGGELFVLRRVKALVRATHRIAGGDYAARVGGPYGRGELHQLSKDFDDMAAALERRVQERDRAEAALRALNQQLEQRVAQRTAQLQRSNEDLEQFAYVASHDLQEPLRVVIKYLELLRDRHGRQLEPKALEFLGYALEGARRMQELILALLAYSRVETQGQPFTRTDCAQVLERVRQSLRLALEESRAVLTCDPLPTLEADEVQLGQLFQNLLSNAIKFRRDEPPQIHIGARRENGTWHFSVRDNGIGIAAESLPRLFMLFQRLHSRSQYPGTGIGLCICKKIVERHGGRIWVESKVGEGTTFHFTLPASPASPPDDPRS